jgi:hypothetical protein
MLRDKTGKKIKKGFKTKITTIKRTRIEFDKKLK